MGIYNLWYLLRLPPTFFYNALGYLNENLTEYFSKEKTPSQFRLK